MNCVVIFVFIVQKQRVMYQDQFMLILKQRLKRYGDDISILKCK